MSIDRHISPEQRALSCAVLIGVAFAMQNEAGQIVARGLATGHTAEHLRVRLLLDLADGFAKTANELNKGGGA